MKLPFERNNYFWGKLLSAEDFIAEQTYFNQKRQLLNRLLHGGGVLCGLDVIKLDDKKLLIQSGAALDNSGREVIIADPVRINIALIEGFSYDNRTGFSYLCVAYEERAWQETIAIEGENRFNRIIEDGKLYFTDEEPLPEPDVQSINEAMNGGGHIYLAKVLFVTGEGVVIVEGVEDMRRMIAIRKETAERTVCDAGGVNVTEEKIDRVLREYMQLVQRHPATASGVEMIDFGLSAKRGRVFFSRSITHGLGAGAVNITLGMEIEGAEGKALGERFILSGDTDIFESEFALASKVNVTAGTFIIGLRLLRDTPLTQAKIFWTALSGYSKSEKADSYISIIPDVSRVSRRESFKFNMEGIGVDKKTAVWSVVEPDGGSVDADGVYRAPNKPGIFEIRVEAGGLMAVAFVIVK